MRTAFCSALLFLTLIRANAQKTTPTTDAFTIEGQVRKELLITLDSLRAYPAETIDSLVLVNHLGQRKSALTDIRGVALKRILDQVDIPVDNPKELSEFYFVFVAADGYKVVFSWNEIFNTKTGDGIFLVAGSNGKAAAEQDNRIAVFSQGDAMTGRRYVKGLKKIVVRRAE